MPSSETLRPRSMFGMYGGTALGVDPGLAACGLAVVSETQEGHFKILHADVITTVKDSGTAGLKISEDDGRRLVAIQKAVMEVICQFKPTLVGLEAYSPLPGKQGNGAFKVATVFGSVHALATSANRPVFSATPQDVRLAFLNRRTGTKEDVAEAVLQLCPKLPKALAHLSRGKHEHAIDAIAHAILVLDKTRLDRRLAQKRGKRISITHDLV